MKLDVRTKVLLVCFANLTFLFRVTGWIELVTVLVLSGLLWAAGRRRMAFYQLVFFALCLLVDGMLLATWTPIWFQMPVTLVRAGRLMLPSILAGSLLLTTSTAYGLIHGLRKWHLPENLLLTLAVMLRFLPAIREDARAITKSLKLRGIFLSPWDLVCHPLRYFEYVMLPLLLALLRRVQDLTMASLTKGLALGSHRSQTFGSPFRWIDWSVCLWMLGMIGWIVL